MIRSSWFRWRRGAWIDWDSSEGQYGLCDRLRAIACGLALAGRLRARLSYRWESNVLCPAEWEDLFSKPARLALPAAGRIVPDTDPLIRITCRANLPPGPFWHWLVQAGMAARFSGYHEFHAAWKTALRRMRPVKCIRVNVRRILTAAAGQNLIGIHLRRTDMLGSSNCRVTTENVEAFDEALWMEVLRRADTIRDARFVLATDDRGYFHLWRQRLETAGLPWVAHMKSWGNGFRQTPVSDALIDLCLLGNCQEVLGSMNSGFLTIAEAHGALITLVSPVPGS